MPVLEKQVEDPVIRWAKKIGLKNRKMNGMGFRSWPDRLFCVPGTPFFIEFKRPGGKPSSLQDNEIKELRELGYDVEVHDSTETAKEAIIRRLQIGSVGAENISKACDKILARAGRGRAVPRSWAR